MKLKKWLCSGLAVITAFATLALTACDLLGGSSSSSAPKAEAQIDYENIVMSCLGDSITDERNSEKYPKMLKQEYKFKAVNNYGSSGATLSNLNEANNLQQQIERVDEDSDIISILAGVNDFLFYSVPLGKQGFSTPNTFYGALDCLVKGLKARCPNAYIFFMTPYKCEFKGHAYSTPNDADLVLSDYVNAIIDVCEQYDLDYLNLFVDGGFNYENAMYTADGLHPLGRFYQEFTMPQVGRFIEENYPSFPKAILKK